MKDVLLLLVYLLSILARMLRPGGLPTGTAIPLVLATTKTVLVLVVHLLATVAKCLGPGGPRAVVAENLLLKHPLLIFSRSRHRTPNLRSSDRFLLGFCSLFVRRTRTEKVAAGLRALTLLNFHRCLVRRKYRALFTPKSTSNPGPKGPSAELIHAIVALERRNPGFGCPRIALIITNTVGIDIDKKRRAPSARQTRPT